MQARRALWLSLAMICPAAAPAGVYRCEQDGRISFSDRACVAGQAPMEIAQPNTIETSADERLLAQQFDADTASLRARREAAAARPRVSAQAAPEPHPRKSPRKASTKRPKSAKAPEIARPGSPSQESAQRLQKLAPPRPR